MPCGNNKTIPDYTPHLVSPEAIKLSIIIYAPLAKSPNYASQITNTLGLAIEYPYSKPSTPYSLKCELLALNFFDFISSSFNKL